MQFDEFQSRFINYQFSPPEVVMLEATPGSGKTTTIVGKIIKDDIDPNKVVVVTFANRMASEIRRKLYKQGKKIELVGTIHGVILKLYRKYVDPNPTIINEWESLKIIREIMYKYGIKFTTKKEDNRIASKIKEYKYYFDANMIKYDEHKLSAFFNNTFPINDNNFISILSDYHQYKEANNMFDFDDIVSDRVINRLPINDIRNQIEVVFHDEAQDASKNNFYVIDKIFGANTTVNVFDVGQTLYAFRWADPTILTNNGELYKDRKITKFTLQNNYRSANNIVNLFNTYRSINMDGITTIPNKDKGKINIITVEKDTQVGRMITKNIKGCYRDNTILVRKSSFIKSVIEPALVSANIPYKVKTPQYKSKFFEQPLNKFIINSLEYIFSKNIKKIIEISDCFPSIGKSFVDRNINKINFNDPKMQIVNSYIDELNSVGIPSNVKEFKRVFNFLSVYIKNHLKNNIFTERSLANSLKIFANFTRMVFEEEGIDSPSEIIYEMTQRIDEYDDDNSDAVTITTIFQYKGRENKNIIVTDMCDSQFDNNISLFPIMYVALSRAIDNLTVIDYLYKHNWKMGYTRVNKYPGWQKTMDYIINQNKRGGEK